jgi:hypothetical protein
MGVSSFKISYFPYSKTLPLLFVSQLKIDIKPHGEQVLNLYSAAYLLFVIKVRLDAGPQEFVDPDPEIAFEDHIQGLPVIFEN